MTSQDYTALQQQLIEHEGLRLRAYIDTRGKVTVGVGRNLSDVGLSLGEAMDLLDHDLAGTIGAMEHAFPWFPRLDGMRQRVLVDMAFNLGTDGLRNFPLFLEAVRTGDYDEAANEMLNSQWATQVKGRAIRLARMMRTGSAT